jgi:hypothetical protein
MAQQLLYIYKKIEVLFNFDLREANLELHIVVIVSLQFNHSLCSLWSLFFHLDQKLVQERSSQGSEEWGKVDLRRS